MKKLIKEILGGVFIAVTFVIVTITLIKSPYPHKYLSFYLSLEIIAFFLFSLYGAALVAIAATFIAAGTLIIAESWLAPAAILTYWAIIVILNKYLLDISYKNGKQNLERENKKRNIDELVTKEESFSNLISNLKEKKTRNIKLVEFSLKLNTSFNDEKLYSFVLEYIKKFFPSREIGLLTVPKDQYDKWVLKKKIPLLVENTDKDYRFKKKQNYNVTSLIECPLFQQNEVIGTIKIESKKSSFTLRDLRVLNIVSTLSSIALEKARLFCRTEELAITDDLTGLHTHTYFKERLEEEVKRSARYGKSFAVFMMDIDNFKHFNDTSGHLAGDIVLKNVANTIKQIVRETDIVGRYGGEEITVILHNISITKAMHIAERIRKSIESMEFVFNFRKICVTLTIGVSYFPDSPTSEVLIKQADDALYTGKEKGKNKVIFSGNN